MTMNPYLVLSDVHHQLDRGEIGGEREAVRDELEERNPRRPHVRLDLVVVSGQAFRLRRGTA